MLSICFSHLKAIRHVITIKVTKTTHTSLDQSYINIVHIVVLEHFKTKLNI